MKIHFIPTSDFITVTKVCEFCFQHESCFCLTKEDRKGKRKESSSNKEGKKKARLAHRESMYR